MKMLNRKQIQFGKKKFKEAHFEFIITWMWLKAETLWTAKTCWTIMSHFTYFLLSSGWTRATRSTWRGWSAGVWRVNSSDSLKPWGAGRTCRTRWDPEPVPVWWRALHWSDSSSGVSYLSASSLRLTPLEPTTLWPTWSPVCRTSTPMTPSPQCPTRKALLCCTTWRNWWEGQVTPGYTNASQTVWPWSMYSPVCWFLFFRGVHGLCEVVHPAVCLQQRHYWGMEELPVHLLQRQGEKHLDAKLGRI